jgi:hypothetical protein
LTGGGWPRGRRCSGVGPCRLDLAEQLELDLAALLHQRHGLEPSQTAVVDPVDRPQNVAEPQAWAQFLMPTSKSKQRQENMSIVLILTVQQPVCLDTG